MYSTYQEVWVHQRKIFTAEKLLPNNRRIFNLKVYPPDRLSNEIFFDYWVTAFRSKVFYFPIFYSIVFIITRDSMNESQQAKRVYF